MHTLEVQYLFLNIKILIGVIHIPRGQMRGEGVSQMTILLHKPYLVKVTTKGESKI